MFIISFQAYKQEQKLRFLITQTELYAHFVSGKTPDKAPLGEVVPRFYHKPVTLKWIFYKFLEIY